MKESTMDNYYLSNENALSQRIFVFGREEKTSLSQWPTNGDHSGEPEKKAVRLRDLLNQGISKDNEEIKSLIEDGLRCCRRYSAQVTLQQLDALGVTNDAAEMTLLRESCEQAQKDGHEEFLVKGHPLKVVHIQEYLECAAELS